MSNNPNADYLTYVQQDFEKWKNTPPNAIQRGTGIITKPVEFALKPFIEKISPLLENTLMSLNDYLAKAIQKFNKEEDKEFIDLQSVSREEFEEWLRKKDKITKQLVTSGVAALTTEGAGTGLGGFALIAVDIPASFGLILTFANLIALNYELDIYAEEIQEELIKSITVGSETTIEGKLEAMTTLKMALKCINTTTWKAMAKAPAKSMPGLIIAVKSFLKKMGVNLTKRKAAQLIPGLGAVAGGVINASWGLDALEAVRQIMRNLIVQAYNENSPGKKILEGSTFDR